MAYGDGMLGPWMQALFRRDAHSPAIADSWPLVDSN
jgi:hypothetical protein